MLQAVEDLLFGPDPIQWVQQLIGLGHPRPFEILSLLGDTWGIILVIGVTMWLWGRETAYALLGLAAAGAVTKELLSMAFSVPRPDSSEIVVYEHLQVTSFPSSHLYQILAPWGLLYAYQLVPLLIPVSIGVLVGIARLYLGVHYLGDLAFAVIFAILLVWGYRHLWPRIQAWFYRRSQTFYLVVGVIVIGSIVASMTFRFNNPRRWEILGMAVGATIGFILEAAGAHGHPRHERNPGLPHHRPFGRSPGPHARPLHGRRRRALDRAGSPLSIHKNERGETAAPKAGGKINLRHVLSEGRDPRTHRGTAHFAYRQLKKSS